jgi:hypothetical protein
MNLSRRRSSCAGFRSPEKSTPRQTPPHLAERPVERLGVLEEVREGVIERLNDLKPHLDLAIDAVEKEVGIVAQLPAAQRVYQPDTPVGFIGDKKTLPPPPQSLKETND